MMHKTYDNLIVTTKLTPPRTTSQLVARDRLLSLIPLKETVPLVLICAPAGFGKTTLTRQYLQHRQQPYAWLSLEPNDNEPQRFLRYVVAALRTLNKNFAEVLFQSLCSTATIAPEHILPLLVNEIAGADNPMLLVLDDFHEINDTTTQQCIAYFIEHMPKDFSLIITSRTEPSLPLARMRVRQQLIEIRAEDLRFRNEELSNYLATQHINTRNVSEDDIVSLNQKTDGWIAGLQLALLSMKNTGDIHQLLTSLSGQDRFIMDYLTDEVLSQQDEATRSFLLTTSILPKMCAPLTEAVSGVDNAEPILKHLESRNLFLFSLDAKQEWFRYHPLFADLLKHQLARRGANSLNNAHIKASHWYLDHHMLDEAIAHAFSARAFDIAGQIIDQHGIRLIKNMQGPLLYRWGKQLPAEYLNETTPGRLFLLIVAALTSGRQFEPQWLAYAGQSINSPSTAPEEKLNLEIITNLIEVMQISRKRDFKSSALLLNEIAGQHQTSQHLLLGDFVGLTGGMTCYWTGEIDAAIHHLQPSCHLAESQNGAMYFPATLNLVAAHIWQGDLTQAEQRLQIAFQDLSRFSWTHSVGHGWLALAQGDLAYERYTLDEARTAYELAAQLTQYSPTNTILLLARARLAEIAALTHQDQQASELAQNVLSTEHRQNASFISVEYDWRIAEMLLTLKHFDQAAQWLDNYHITLDDEPTAINERLYLCLAKLAIQQHRAASALSLLSGLGKHAAHTGRLHTVMESEFLLALVLLAQGKTRQAKERFSAAISLAQQTGCYQFLAQTFPGSNTLLQGVLKTADPDPVVARIHYDASILTETSPPGSASQLKDPLSPKELKVLNLLAQGLANADIARQMFVSENTVKTHLKHIFTKLSAKNRAQAILLAGRYGLIDDS